MAANPEQSQQQTPKPAADEARDDPAPVPEEDGPHDVPDAAVIEKTLPSRPVGNREAPGV